MIEAWGELNVRETFAEAARTFVALVARIPQNRWNGPGLGEWNLRSLVGHTSRSLVTVENYLGQPTEIEEVPSPAAYYVAIAGIDHAAVVGRGVEAGQALGENPAEFVAELASRVLDPGRICRQSADAHGCGRNAPRELPADAHASSWSYTAWTLRQPYLTSNRPNSAISAQRGRQGRSHRSSAAWSTASS